MNEKLILAASVPLGIGWLLVSSVKPAIEQARDKIEMTITKKFF